MFSHWAWKGNREGNKHGGGEGLENVDRDAGEEGRDCLVDIEMLSTLFWKRNKIEQCFLTKIKENFNTLIGQTHKISLSLF